GLENRALIAPDDSLVDDLRHQSRQQQDTDRLCEREHQYDRDVSPVRLEETKQSEHGGGGTVAKEGPAPPVPKTARRFNTIEEPPTTPRPPFPKPGAR